MVYDLGWGEPGCYGNTFNETPHIDAMAQSGMRFTTAYASATVCSPSRAGLLTGQAPQRNYRLPAPAFRMVHSLKEWGIANNELPEDTDCHLSTDLVTLPQTFKQQGYATGMIGKWHLSGYDENGVKHGPEKYGFDEVLISEQVGIAGGSYFHPYVHVDAAIEPVLRQNEYLVDRMNYGAVEFIKRHKDKPFCLHLSHYAVHTELVGKKADVDYFSEQGGYTNLPYEERSRLPENNPVLAAILKSVGNGVGDIRAILRELDLGEDTLIVFTSDNGGKVGVTVNAHLRNGKSTTYEGGLRVSLVIEYPAVIAPGSVSDQPTTNLDFYPTFVDFSGYEIPEAQISDGASIVSLLQAEGGADLLSRRPMAWHYPLDQPHGLGGRSSAANRREAFKYILFFDDSTDESYNLKEDESEPTNLVAACPQQKAELQGQLKVWISDVNGCIPAGPAGIE